MHFSTWITLNWSECYTIWLLEGSLGVLCRILKIMEISWQFLTLLMIRVFFGSTAHSSIKIMIWSPWAPHWVPEMSQGISSFCSAGGQGSELNNNLFSPCKVLLMNFCKHWSRHSKNNTSDNNNDGCNICNNNGCYNNNPNNINNINNTPSET